MRRLPGFELAKRIAPAAINQIGQRLLKRPWRENPEWDPYTLRSVSDLYREDSRRLLEYCGKSDDYWSLDH